MLSARLVLVVLASALAVTSVGGLETIPVQQVTEELFCVTNTPAGGGDIYISPCGNWVDVHRANLETGMMDWLRNETGIVVALPSANMRRASTNGDWIVVGNDVDGVDVFQLDLNAEPINRQFIPQVGVDARGFALAPSGAYLVGMVKNSLYYVHTYQFNGTAWDFVEATSLPDHNYGCPDSIVTVANDVLVLNVPFTGIFYFFRHVPGAENFWTLFDSVDAGQTSSSNLIIKFNGVGTLITHTSSSTYIIDNTTDGWVTTPVAAYGRSIEFLDDDSVLVIEDMGYAVIYHRMGSTWNKTYDIVGAGYKTVQALEDALILSAGYYDETVLYALPKCFLDPIDVTCIGDQELDYTCQLPAEYYTINNPQCGFTNATQERMENDGRIYYLEFSFSRAAVPAVTCNITLTCAEPPVAPVAAPVAAPAAAPRKPTSAASLTRAWLGLIVISAAVLLH